MNKEKTTIKVVTGKVRFNYVNVLKPQVIGDGAEPRYSIVLLIPKTEGKTLRLLKDAIDEVRVMGAVQFGSEYLEDIKLPLKDGDLEMYDKPEYKDHYYINATSKYKVGVVDRDLRNITEASEIYSGCYGRASLVFYPYNKNDNSGVGCGLKNIQKLEDGEALYANTAADDFESFTEVKRESSSPWK